AGCYLAKQYPQLWVSGSGSTGFMQLSGTSIAAPAVAGAGALAGRGDPGVATPLVKTILPHIARQLPYAKIVEQGAGLLNIDGAVRLAGALRHDVSTAISLGTIKVGDSLLAPNAAMPVPVSTLDGQTFSWGGYIFAGGSHVLAGTALFRQYQLIYN